MDIFDALIGFVVALGVVVLFSIAHGIGQDSVIGPCKNHGLYIDHDGTVIECTVRK